MNFAFGLFAGTSGIINLIILAIANSHRRCGEEALMSPWISSKAIRTTFKDYGLLKCSSSDGENLKLAYIVDNKLANCRVLVGNSDLMI